MSDDSILLIGGYGAVGSEAARTTRRLYPHVKLTIAGRDHTRAMALADELGSAEGVECDLTTPGLGLPSNLSHQGIVVFAKDDRLHALDHAIATGATYISISDYAVEIAPLVARSGSDDGSHVPIFLLGHHLGGLVTMATLHHTRDFAEITAVRVGAIFDEADLGGTTAQADAERLARATPHPLILHDSQWIWAEEPQLTRQFSGTDGTVYTGEAISILDVPSIAATTKAHSVRFDVAIHDSAITQQRHEVVIEVDGLTKDHQYTTLRISINGEGFHTAISGHTVAFALEQLLGLDGKPATPPGLWLPEKVLDAAHVVSRARASGVMIDAQHEVMA